MAATTVYTTSDIVGDFLPNGQTKVSAGDFTRLISEASRTIDTRPAKRYIPFNDVTGTPATPAPIGRIATKMVASEALQIVMVGARNSELLAYALQLRDEADRALDNLRDGLESLPEESSTQTLVPGSGGTYDLATYEAQIASTNPVTSGDVFTLIPTSVRVTGAGYTQYHQGEHYTVRFDTELQIWVFVDLKNDYLSQSAVAKTISYDWSYERYTDFRKTGAQASTRKFLSVP